MGDTKKKRERKRLKKCLYVLSTLCPQSKLRATVQTPYTRLNEPGVEFNETLARGGVWDGWGLEGGVFVQPRKQKRINNTIDPFPLYRIETNSFYENEDWFFLKKVGHSRPLLFIFCLSDTVVAIKKTNVQYKFCWWLDSNRVLLVMEATILPTEPQPLPVKGGLF